MADSAIQGDEFPAHVVWDKTSEVKIRVACPESIEIKEAYNVPEGGKKTVGTGLFEFTKFGVNGYIGLVFSSKRLDKTLARERVTFEVGSSGDASPSRHVRDIYLFRPSLEIGHVPSKLQIKYDSKRESWKISDKIRIQNKGSGTALIEVALVPQGDFERHLPPNIDEFLKGFVRDMEAKLKIVSLANPKHSEIVQDYLSFLKTPTAYDEKGRATIKSIIERMTAALQDDRKFSEAFASAIVVSYLKNVQLITELTSFMEYLDSIGEGRVMIRNSFDVVKPKNAAGGLMQLEIRVTDLAFMDYPLVELEPIQVAWEGSAAVPIHMLFDWGSKPRAGR